MTIQDILEFTKQNNIPTINDEAWELLKNTLLNNQPKSILEIGTGSGYSAAKILECVRTYTYLDKISFTTIEIDPDRFELSMGNLKALGLYQNAEMILDDAAAILGQYVLENRLFDLVFLDGAKGQYINYLPQILKILPIGGIMFCDNLSFHGLAKSGKDAYHKMRTIAVNLQKFQKAILKSPQLKCKIFEAGNDHVAICQKNLKNGKI